MDEIDTAVIYRQPAPLNEGIEHLNEYKHYDPACKGCAYLSHNLCNYILIEEHRRPCEPGKYCTVKTKDPEIRKKVREDGGWSGQWNIGRKDR